MSFLEIKQITGSSGETIQIRRLFFEDVGCHWFHGTTEITKNERIRIIEDRDNRVSILKINNLQIKDKGLYTSKVGGKSAEYIVHIEGKLFL